MTREIEERVLNIAQHTIATGSTVRETAKVFEVSKSTVHEDLSRRLKELDEELYEKSQEVLQFNLSQRHIRGGMATKALYTLSEESV